MPSRPLHISKIQQTKTNGKWRVSAEVGGDQLWFESDNMALKSRVEAFLAAFFIPALHYRYKMHVNDEIDSGWVENTKKLLPIFHRWWNYPSEYPIEVGKNGKNSAKTSQKTLKKSRAALCFSGGVDSFYSLLRTSPDVHYLLFINGFDIGIKETKRFENFKQSLLKISKEKGKVPIIVHTNMREHPIFKRVNWERSHGAALAAVGLLLDNNINSLTIPSSFPYNFDIAWGSHWDTDPLWSLPGDMQIIHDESFLLRSDKIVTIADNPIVQKYLRVCYENKTASGNCSNCEKCLRTIVALTSTGHFEKYSRVFDTQTPLPLLLDRLNHIPERLIFIWQDLALRSSQDDVRDAINRLILRSKISFFKKRPKRIYVSLKSFVRSFAHILGY